MRSLFPSLDEAAAATGFSLDQIILKGHAQTYDGDVFAALKLEEARSYLMWDARAAKSRVEQLPWVHTAQILRVYPNTVEITITERKPYAVWRVGNRFQLIDGTGRVLSSVGKAKAGDLPKVAGEGAAREAKAMFDLMAAFPDIRSRFLEAERVGRRRWNLHLADNITLKLPASGEAAALAALKNDADLNSLLNTTGTTIDFRGRGQVSVKRNESDTREKPDAVSSGANS